MPQIFSYKALEPQYDSTNYLAPGVQIIGDVRLGENANIWHNSVVRADVNKVCIGKNVNIQDLSMLHVTSKDDLIIEDNVSVGHHVILHGCTIGAGSLIGMGANILDGAVIGKNCLVAGGSVVPPGKVYPDGSFIMGIPGVKKRDLTDEEILQISNHYKSYLRYAKEFMDTNVVKRLL